MRVSVRGCEVERRRSTGGDRGYEALKGSHLGATDHNNPYPQQPEPLYANPVNHFPVGKEQRIQFLNEESWLINS